MRVSVMDFFESLSDEDYGRIALGVPAMATLRDGRRVVWVESRVISLVDGWGVIGDTGREVVEVLNGYLSENRLSIICQDFRLTHVRNGDCDNHGRVGYWVLLAEVCERVEELG